MMFMTNTQIEHYEIEVNLPEKQWEEMAGRK